MEWQDEGIVLGRRRHGENSLIVSLLTRAHGRHAGLVRGGSSSRSRGIYQPGNRVDARWRARLEEHLGHWTCELVDSGAARLLDDPPRLAALSAACALVEAGLPEREPQASVFEDLALLLDTLEGPAWGRTYVRWEVALLGDLGFGLDLGTCAATGVNDGLAYVSPKSGRAVSLSAGEPWKERLLPLPRFLTEEHGSAAADEDPDAVVDGLRMTGYFLERYVFHGAPLPAARDRLVERLRSNTEADR